MRRPDTAVLAVFLLIVLAGGSNFVAVRFSNRELAPFWGAAVRFVAAGLLLLAYARARRLALPSGAALAGTVVFGLANFGVGYALAYWGLLSAPAALASTISALAPLLTFVIAVALGMESFRWGGVIGGLVAVAGVGVVFADQLRETPLPSILALLGVAVAIAVGTILAKRLPRLHPTAINGVAMLPGAALLLALSFVAGEPRVAPAQATTWTALGYLVLSTMVLFLGFFYVVRRWTASASAYATVLFPIVTVVIGAILARELVSAQFVAGTALVMAGVYVGAIAQPAPTVAVAAPAPKLD